MMGQYRLLTPALHFFLVFVPFRFINLFNS